MLQLQNKSNSRICGQVVHSKVSLGRDSANDIVLDDPLISGFHANIFYENGKLVIIDLGSSNGSYVNGERIQGRVELKAWDVLKLGDTELEVVDTDSRRPTTVQAAVPDSIVEQLQDRSDRKSGSEPAAFLHLISGGDYPGKVSINGAMQVGRAAESSILLSLDTVSSRHAKIVQTASGLEVVDLGSSNGTFVNSKKIQRKQLSHGDRVKFDEIEYRVEISSQDFSKTTVHSSIDKTNIHPVTPPQHERSAPTQAGIHMAVPEKAQSHPDYSEREQPPATGTPKGGASNRSRSQVSKAPPVPPKQPLQHSGPQVRSMASGGNQGMAGKILFVALAVIVLAVGGKTYFENRAKTELSSLLASAGASEVISYRDVSMGWTGDLSLQGVSIGPKRELFVDEVVIGGIDKQALLEKQPPTYADITFKGVTLTIGKNEMIRKFPELYKLGYDNVKGTMHFKYRYSTNSQRLTLDDASFDANDIGKFHMSMNMNFPAVDVRDQAQILLAMAQAKMNSASMRFQDRGLMNRYFEVANKKLGKGKNDLLKELDRLRPRLSGAERQLLDAVTDFVKGGNQIQVNMNFPTPVALNQIEGAIKRGAGSISITGS